MDCCPAGSSVHGGISQARIQWRVTSSFSGDLLDPGIEPNSAALAGGFFTSWVIYRKIIREMRMGNKLLCVIKQNMFSYVNRETLCKVFYLLVKVSLYTFELDCFWEYLYFEDVPGCPLCFSWGWSEVSGTVKELGFISTCSQLLCSLLLFYLCSERKEFYSLFCWSPDGVTFINRIYKNF